MDFQNITFESVEGRVGVVTLKRPSVLNALSISMRTELEEALTAAEVNRDIRALVITGSGEKAFSAGADIHEMAKLSPDELAQGQKQMLNLMWHAATLKIPTIGAINGIAYGGGAFLASVLDIRIGCERTKFRFLAAQYGRLNSSWSLPIVVGWARAKELLYTARAVEASEAAQIGLLNKQVSSDQLLNAAVEMARQIARNIPECVQHAKVLLQEDIGRTWQEMYSAEVKTLTSELKPSPVAEGFADFLSRKGHKQG